MANDFDPAVQKLNDPKQGVRKTALRDLSELGTEVAVDFIGEKVIADRSKDERLLVTNLLANIRQNLLPLKRAKNRSKLRKNMIFSSVSLIPWLEAKKCDKWRIWTTTYCSL